MPVTKDENRRSVALEIELPGTPEDVWRAIATGPGMSCWFVPTEVEERVGGAIAFHFGPGVSSPGRVTGWEPPRRFAYEEPGWMENMPPLATEVVVETRAGGTCVVRMVHTYFTSSDDWNDQLESFEKGWRGFFRVLRLYMTHFRGQPCTSFRLLGAAAESEPRSWETLKRLLGLSDPAPGSTWRAPAGVPPLAGTIEAVGESEGVHEATLRLDRPAPGTALVGTFEAGGKVQAALSFYLYGPAGAEAAAREEPLWQAWMNTHFPPPANEVP